MATLTKQTISRAGLNPDPLDSADVAGDEFVNSGQEFVEINNGGGSPITVTLVTQKTVDGEAVDDKTVTIPNGERRLIGPFPASVYNDVDKKVQLTYSAVTSVGIGLRGL